MLEIGWTAPLFAMFRAQPITYYLFFAGLYGAVAWLAWWFFSRGEDASTKRTMGIAFAVVAVLAVVGLHFAKNTLIANEVYIMPAGQTLTAFALAPAK